LSPRGSSSRYIYVIGPLIGDGQDHTVKIGKSCNPAARCRELQAGSPIELMIHATWKFTGDASEVEAECHREFLSEHSHGEWFRVSAAQVGSFIEEMSRFLWTRRSTGITRYTSLDFEFEGPRKVAPIQHKMKSATFVRELAARFNLAGESSDA
jgi:hypothetical protein